MWQTLILIIMKYRNYFIQELNYLYAKAVASNDTVLQAELMIEINKRNKQ